MNAYRQLLLAVAIIGVGGGMTASSAESATFRWINPQGGEWHESNWDLPGYPQSFWDFALFPLEGRFEVRATDAARTPGAGLLTVNAGDVVLRAHDDFRTVTGVGTSSTPASLTLREGVISGGGQHTVGPHGTMVLEHGSRLVSHAQAEVGFVIQDGGVLRGDGASLENRVLRNFGTISPGLAPAEVGCLILGEEMPAGYVQRETGVLEIDIGGAEPGQGHDQLRVAQVFSPVTLDGRLVVTLIDGYVPAAYEKYAVLVAPEISGTFGEVVLPTPASHEFEVIYESDKVTVVARALAPPVIHSLVLQPGRCQRRINLKRRGVVRAAILASADLDPRDIDISTLSIAGVAPLRCNFKDIGTAAGDEQCACLDADRDGREDLTLKFRARELAAALKPLLGAGENVITVSGMLLDGGSFEAQGCAVLRSRGRGNDRPGRGNGRGGRSSAELEVMPGSLPSETMQLVTYSLPEAGTVSLSVFSVTGRKVAEVVRAEQPAGDHSITWDTWSLPNGVYVYRLEALGRCSSAKLLLIR